MHYDSLLAKLCVWHKTRDAAVARARAAAAEFRRTGVKTNLEFLRDLLDAPAFVSGEYDTRFVESGGVPKR